MTNETTKTMSWIAEDEDDEILNLSASDLEEEDDGDCKMKKQETQTAVPSSSPSSVSVVPSTTDINVLVLDIQFGHLTRPGCEYYPLEYAMQLIQRNISTGKTSILSSIDFGTIRVPRPFRALTPYEQSRNYMASMATGIPWRKRFDAIDEQQLYEKIIQYQFHQIMIRGKHKHVYLTQYLHIPANIIIQYKNVFNNKEFCNVHDFLNCTRRYNSVKKRCAIHNVNTIVKTLSM
nr:hypothetical protein [Microctonus hyperodae filamentous virus]